MKKIVFGITNLSIGGAERTLVDLSNTLCNNYEITIFTIYANGELEKQLNSNIKIINLYDKSYENLSLINKKLSSLKIFLLYKSIYKKYIKNKYDVEVAFLEGPITRLFSVKNKLVKKIAWIHTDISLIFGTGLKAKIKKIINRKTYNKYNDIAFVSKFALERFNKTYNINRKINKHIIYNFIDINKIIELSKEEIDFKFDNNTINFLSVCRLVKPKAIDRLVKIHSQLIQDGFNHKIYIIGDGPEKNKIENLIKSYNVEKSFILLGPKNNPYPYIKKCAYFCLLSYYEGYGIVIEEAKALSKYIVVTDTASKEALEDYDYKTIIPNDEKNIYDNLRNLIINNKSKDIHSYYYYDNNIIIKKIIEVLGD